MCHHGLLSRHHCSRDICVSLMIWSAQRSGGHPLGQSLAVHLIKFVEFFCINMTCKNQYSLTLSLVLSRSLSLSLSLVLSLSFSLSLSLVLSTVLSRSLCLSFSLSVYIYFSLSLYLFATIAARYSHCATLLYICTIVRRQRSRRCESDEIRESCRTRWCTRRAYP